MPFLRIDIDVASAEAQAVEDLCLSLGAVAVTLVDQRDDPVLEPAPGEVRLWPATCVQALFGADETGRLPDERALMIELGHSGGLAAGAMRAQTLADRVWEREWLRDFRPMQFGERLWIVPGEWPTPPGAAVVMRLDPGLAFGTGTHATTAMCLRWLERDLQPGTAMIDYGCGSGVLAVAALLLGAGSAQAFDIDPQALLATAENAARNGVGHALQVLPTAANLAPADLVVANILAGPLCELAPRLCGLLRPGGTLVLAGLLQDQVASLQEAYAPGIALQITDQQDSWVLLTGQRPRDAAQFQS